ncbi:hypothetical protein [Candidatus Bealeia paramacronuclearis]
MSQLRFFVVLGAIIFASFGVDADYIDEQIEKASLKAKSYQITFPQLIEDKDAKSILMFAPLEDLIPLFVKREDIQTQENRKILKKCFFELNNRGHINTWMGVNNRSLVAYRMLQKELIDQDAFDEIFNREITELIYDTSFVSRRYVDAPDFFHYFQTKKLEIFKKAAERNLGWISQETQKDLKESIKILEDPKLAFPYLIERGRDHLRTSKYECDRADEFLTEKRDAWHMQTQNYAQSIHFFLDNIEKSFFGYKKGKVYFEKLERREVSFSKDFLVEMDTLRTRLLKFKTMFSEKGDGFIDKKPFEGWSDMYLKGINDRLQKIQKLLDL